MFSFHPDRQNLGKGPCYARGWRIAEGTATSLSWAISLHATSPIVFKDGYRTESNFISADWVGLDFDEGPSIAEIQKTFCDRIHVLGTTKSHQKPKGNSPPCDRFRLWLKLSHTITRVIDYKETIRYLVRTYEADPACVGAAQLFWPCNTIRSVEDEGYTTDVLVGKETTYSKPQREYNGRIPYWVRDWLDGKVPVGTRNLYVFRASAWLTKNGWPEKEIVDMVMGSGIMNANNDVPLEPDEVIRAVRSGRNRALKEMS